ncbi:MAG: hypothetical protein GY906_10915 [bacterium]|nr:hypothetical protein [bacterium]
MRFARVQVYRHFLLCWLLLLSTGCATMTSYPPIDATSAPFQERAVTKSQGDLIVTVAVPSPSEARELFGFKIDKKHIQPIWLEIENRSDRTHWFFIRNLDPDYFSPLEVAWMGRKKYTKEARVEMERAFYDAEMPLRISPNDATTGFVFANQTLGARQVLVEILDENENVYEFDFTIAVPGLRTDYMQINPETFYDSYTDLDDEGIKRWIAEQPCCVSNAKDTKHGDPVNMVIIGTAEAVWPAFVRAGWNVTEAMTSGSMWRTIKSSLFRNRYLYSPVSSLYLFERPQDIALQKARGTVDERNHLRLWLAPVTYKGTPVLIGQISRDIGIRFTTKSPTISTHKIDPDVDETRAFILMDLLFAQSVERYGYVGGVGAAPIEAPRGNLTGDPYVTDGLRLVMFLTDEEIPKERSQYLHWDQPGRH